MIIRVLISLSILAILTACSPDGKNGRAHAGNPGARPPVEVTVMVTQPGTVLITREYPGRLRAWRSAEVRARVEGIVEERLFTQGAEVKAGDTLFRIEDQTYRAALQAAETELEVAQLAVKRKRELLRKNLVAPDAVDEARARLEQARVMLARAKQDLDNTRVPAPITGRIGRSWVTEGALVGRGEPTLLAVIEQIDPLYVEFSRPASELRTLRATTRPGQIKAAADSAITVLYDNGQAYSHSGRILFSERRVDPATGTIFVRASLPNPEHSLLPGAFVRTRAAVAQVSDVIRIPQQSVRAGRDGLEVLVVKPGGQVVSKAITTLGMDGADFLVSAGLKAGEQVIVEGLQKVRPGTVVKAVPRQAVAPSPPATPAGH